MRNEEGWGGFFFVFCFFGELGFLEEDGSKVMGVEV